MSRTSFLACWVIPLVCASTGCGSDAPGTRDGGAGSDAAGPRDTGASDGGAPDSGVSDAGSLDTGPGPDVGAPDTGSLEAEIEGALGPMPTNATGFRIGTWNLESFPKASTTVTDAARVIRAMNVDVLAVQEVDEPAAFTSLLAELPEYDGMLNSDPDGYIQVGVLYRRARVRLERAATLFRSDWYRFPRPPLWAQMTFVDALGNDVFDFSIVVLHLKARVDRESFERRLAAIQWLDQWVDGQTGLPGAEQDWILLGDLNDELEDPDNWNAFLPMLTRPDRYAFLTQPLSMAGDFSFVPFSVMIDHIIMTDDARTEFGTGTTAAVPMDVFMSDYDARLSDHRPVVATFHIPR